MLGWDLLANAHRTNPPELAKVAAESQRMSPSQPNTNECSQSSAPLTLIHEQVLHFAVGEGLGQELHEGCADGDAPACKQQALV